jgi:hypothetical protein
MDVSLPSPIPRQFVKKTTSESDDVVVSLSPIKGLSIKMKKCDDDDGRYEDYDDEDEY